MSLQALSHCQTPLYHSGTKNTVEQIKTEWILTVHRGGHFRLLSVQMDSYCTQRGPVRLPSVQVDSYCTQRGPLQTTVCPSGFSLYTERASHTTICPSGLLLYTERASADYHLSKWILTVHREGQSRLPSHCTQRGPVTLTSVQVDYYFIQRGPIRLPSVQVDFHCTQRGPVTLTSVQVDYYCTQRGPVRLPSVGVDSHCTQRGPLQTTICMSGFLLHTGRASQTTICLSGFLLYTERASPDYHLSEWILSVNGEGQPDYHVSMWILTVHREGQSDYHLSKWILTVHREGKSHYHLCRWILTVHREGQSRLPPVQVDSHCTQTEGKSDYHLSSWILTVHSDGQPSTICPSHVSPRQVYFELHYLLCLFFLSSVITGYLMPEQSSLCGCRNLPSLISAHSDPTCRLAPLTKHPTGWGMPCEQCYLMVIGRSNHVNQHLQNLVSKCWQKHMAHLKRNKKATSFFELFSFISSTCRTKYVLKRLFQWVNRTKILSKELFSGGCWCCVW